VPRRNHATLVSLPPASSRRACRPCPDFVNSLLPLPSRFGMRLDETRREFIESSLRRRGCRCHTCMKLRPAFTHFSFGMTLLGVFGCSTLESSDENTSDQALNAVAGEYQVRLQAQSGEDIVMGFDRTVGGVAGRPECQTILANPLRIAVSKGLGLPGSQMTVSIDAYHRARTIAFGPSPSDSRSNEGLARASNVSFRAELPNVVVAMRCSGEPIEYFQNIKVWHDGVPLIDPVGQKDNFWVTFEAAKKGGVSATSRHKVELQSVTGSRVNVDFGKFTGDDPSSPSTCEQIQALPARLTVTPGAPAQDVRVDIKNIMHGTTIASTVVPSSPGQLILKKGADGSFSGEIPPMVISSRCSGTLMEYTQRLELTVDGVLENDPLGQTPTF